MLDFVQITVIDESMSARVPKATKTGGMPSHTFIPRKPKGLGTEMKNSAVPSAGCIIHNEIAMASEQMHNKMFSKYMSRLPGRRNQYIGNGTAIALRQVYATGATAVVGDAGFGSVELIVMLQTCHDLLERQGPVEGFFIVKTSNHLYPQRVLKVRRCRHRDH